MEIPGLSQKDIGLEITSLLSVGRNKDYSILKEENNLVESVYMM